MQIYRLFYLQQIKINVKKIDSTFNTEDMMWLQFVHWLRAAPNMGIYLGYNQSKNIEKQDLFVRDKVNPLKSQERPTVCICKIIN